MLGQVQSVFREMLFGESADFQHHIIIRKLVIFVGAILIAHSELETGGIGKIEKMFYLAAILSSFWVDGFLRAALSYVPKLKEAKKVDFLNIIEGRILLFGVLAFIFSFLLFQLLAWFFQLQFSRVSFLVFLCGHLLSILSLSKVHSLYILDRKDLIRIANYVYLIMALLPFVLMLIQAGLSVFVYAYLICHLSVFFVLWALGSFQKLNFRKPMRSFSRMAYLLMLYSVINQIAIYFDAWLVGWYYEDDAVFALFRYGSREFPLFTVLALSMSSAAVLKMANNSKLGLRFIKKQTENYLTVVLVLGIMIMLSVRYWFPALFGERFLQVALLFNCYVLLVLSYAIFPQSILISKGSTRALLWISGVENVVHILLSVLLISRFGFYGIAFAAITSYLLEKALQCVYLYKRYQIHPGSYIPLRRYIVFVFILLSGFVLSYYLF